MTLRSLLLLAALLAGCTPVPVPRGSAYHPSDADLGVTRIVHGSLVLELRGTLLVVDPWFHSGTLQRQQEPLGLTPDALPAAAAVLLTQGGSDHFDAEALHAIAETTPRAVVPVPLRERVAALGFQEVTTLLPWDRATVGEVTVIAVPAQGKDGLQGYVLEAHGVRAYVAGDTLPFPELVDVATAFPSLDVAVLPIGGRRFLGVRQEMDPEQAAEAAALLKPAKVIPYDYGATHALPFTWNADDAVKRFQKAMQERGLAARVVVLQPGESWHWSR